LVTGSSVRRVSGALIGSSIGSWRFACACLPDPVGALERLGELYTAQRFFKGITAAQVSEQCRQMLDDLMQGQEAEILAQEKYQLNVLVARSRGILGSDARPLLGMGLAAVVLANTLHRPWLRLGFERLVLHDPRARPPLDTLDALSGRYYELAPDNLRDALLASGSIPLVMEAVDAIKGVPGKALPGWGSYGLSSGSALRRGGPGAVPALYGPGGAGLVRQGAVLASR